MIKAEGSWSTPLFNNGRKWNINYSDILTKLIQYAGRYCESYASDLFIIWTYCVERKLENPDLESYSVRFGFREMGIDHEVSDDAERTPITNNLNNNSYYYRKIVTLEINIEGDEIKMVLK